MVLRGIGKVVLVVLVLPMQIAVLRELVDRDITYAQEIIVRVVGVVHEQ